MKSLLCAVCVFVFVLISVQIASAQQYSFTDLGTLGGTNSYANSINASGQVTGYFETGVGVFTHAFRYSNGVMQDIGTLGGYISAGNSINDTSQIVGYSSPNFGNNLGHAFLYSNGIIQDLGTLSGDRSTANGINNQGQIVGTARTTTGTYHAFIYSNGSMLDITPLSNFSYAVGINDIGQVVGKNADTGNIFLYSNGSTNHIGTGEPYGINASGHVVGQNAGNAFIYRNGMMENIVTGAALGINSYDQVVGVNGGSAFLYSNGLVQNLNLLTTGIPSGWSLSAGNAINDTGWIVGTVRTSSGHDHACLLTPIPSPASLCLLCLGSLMLSRKRLH